MVHVNPYIRFNGNCRQAFEFYKNCLGGELSVQTIGESPMAEQMGPAMKDKVMHASLIKDGVVLLMGSDLLQDEGFVPGNTISISFNASSEAEINLAFANMSAGGRVNHPLKEEFWGGLYADLTDKFDLSWIFNYQKK